MIIGKFANRLCLGYTIYSKIQNVIAKIANLEDQRVRDFHNIGAVEESRVWDGMGE